MNSNNPTIQAQWSSKWAFILAATGAAVGLGNIWRFPYLMGSHGGSAFLFLYLFFLCVLGLPILIAEILIGRHARLNAIDAMSTLAIAHQHSRHWQWVSIIGAVALLLILSFYSVVSGWSIAYLWHSLTIGFSGNSAAQIQQTWQHLMSHPWQLLFWHSVFMTLTIGVIILGVEQGLEWATKIMMPALYVILIALVIIAIHFGQINQALHYLFDFNWQAINMNTAAYALGQAFFTLAVGAGAMLTYGAYAPKTVSIPFSVFVIAVLDIIVALLAGLAIFPLVFHFHLTASAGPSLMFITLPTAFSHIAGGNYIAALFFILLLFAAWTSSINLAEPLVRVLIDKHKLSRHRAALLVGLVAWVLGIANLLSFNVWQHVQFFHHTLFELNVNIATNIILPLGGLGYAIFAGWILPQKITANEINSSIYPYWRFLTRYIAPAAIIYVLLYGILHS